MTLESTLQKSFAEWRPDSVPTALETKDEASGWLVRVAAEQVDALSARLTEMALARLTPLADAGDLRARAEAIAARVSCLGEALRLVEVDGEQQTALLRSASPRLRDDQVLYFELHAVADGAMTLHRYQGSHQPATRRERISFTLPHETLAQLAGELAGAW